MPSLSSHASFHANNTAMSEVPTPALPRSDQTAALTLLARDIKLAHSVFALPFALFGACYAVARTESATSGTQLLTPRFAGQVALIIACMVLARTWAMLVNRLADRAIDAKNARTQRRALASGAVVAKTGWSVALACAAGFIACCSLFLIFFNNPLPLALCVPVLFWIGAYSYTKRFTWLCHAWLGMSLAASPICAAVALNPASLHTPTLWLLAAFIACWVAGFDIIYALQDQDFDRSQKLHSIPAAFGWRGALLISRVLHVVSICALVAMSRLDPVFGTLLLVGIIAAATLLAYEHLTLAKLEASAIKPRDDGSDNPPPALNMIFFTLNGVLSCVLGACAISDLFL